MRAWFHWWTLTGTVFKRPRPGEIVSSLREPRLPCNWTYSNVSRLSFQCYLFYMYGNPVRHTVRRLRRGKISSSTILLRDPWPWYSSACASAKWLCVWRKWQLWREEQDSFEFLYFPQIQKISMAAFQFLFMVHKNVTRYFQPWLCIYVMLMMVCTIVYCC